MDGSPDDGAWQVLSGWGNTPRSAARVLVPRNDEEAGAAVRSCEKTPALARGLGRSYGDASLNAGGTVVDMSREGRVHAIDVQQGTISVSAGMSFDTLLRILVPLGFFLPVTPGTRFVTVGGALAADVHGKNHHVDGSIQRFVESFDLLLADGTTICVRPETEPDIFAATFGGLGLTGIITRVTLRLLRIETAFMRVVRERTAGLEETLARFRESDADFQYSVAWVDCLAKGRAMGRSVLMQANHAGEGDLPAGRRDDPLGYETGLPVTWPAWSPPGLLRPATLAAFNEVVYRRAPASPHETIEGITPYFYPLDRVRHWNRAYGPRGFVQYQFVVPDGAESTLRQAIETMSKRGCPSLFAVLKRMGPGTGMLSFPMPGWTLALDIPAGAPGLARILDELDEAVADAGGRVYLAKDARMRPEMVPAMYPELGRWREVRKRLDPERRWQSDLSRRLKLA